MSSVAVLKTVLFILHCCRALESTETNETKYPRMDQVKFVEYKKILLGPFWNTFFHMRVTVTRFQLKPHLCFSVKNINFQRLSFFLLLKIPLTEANFQKLAL